MAAATFGSLAKKSRSGLMKPAMLVNDDKAHRTETGKICGKVLVLESLISLINQDRAETHPYKRKDPNPNLDHPFPNEFRAIGTHR